MMQTHGTWGERIVTRQTPYSITTILYLKPNKRCSWHKHQRAFNQFFVISGALGVKTETGGVHRQTTWIAQRQTFTVPPGVMHEFRTGTAPAVVEEIAYVEYEASDIYREQLGGDFLGSEEHMNG